MKSINNINTLNALIKDEKMAYIEYAKLATDIKVPLSMRKILIEMSRDEKKHHDNLVKYKQYLQSEKYKEGRKW